MAYDPIQPTQTRYDGYPVEAFTKKDIIFIQGGITLSRKWIPGCISVLHIKVSLLQRENTKNREIVRHTDVISENKRWKCPFMVPLQTILA